MIGSADISHILLTFLNICNLGRLSPLIKEDQLLDL
jgi:hypothetical protein